VVLGVLAVGGGVAAWFLLDESQWEEVTGTIGGTLSSTVETVASAAGVSMPPSELAAGIAKPPTSPLWIEERLRLPVLGGLRAIGHAFFREKRLGWDTRDYRDSLSVLSVLPEDGLLLPQLLYVDRPASGVATRTKYLYPAKQFNVEKWFDADGSMSQQPEPDLSAATLLYLLKQLGDPPESLRDPAVKFSLAASMSWQPADIDNVEFSIASQVGDLVDRVKMARFGEAMFWGFTRDEADRVSCVTMFDERGEHAGDLLRFEYGSSAEPSSMAVVANGLFDDVHSGKKPGCVMNWDVSYSNGAVSNISSVGQCNDDDWEYDFQYTIDDLKRVIGADVVLRRAQHVDKNGRAEEANSRYMHFIAETAVNINVTYVYDADAPQWREATARGELAQVFRRPEFSPTDKRAMESKPLPEPFTLELGEIRMSRPQPTQP